MVRLGSSSDPYEFAARMTEYQLRSIARRVYESDTVENLKKLERITTPRVSQTTDLHEIQKWLNNAWNTELILKSSSKILDGASGAALQWTFPQSYYACFSFCLAFYELAGFTQKSHTSVKRKFSSLVSNDELPYSISFLADGTEKNMVFKGLDPTKDEVTSINFQEDNPQSWDKQIEQFLRSTRKIELENKKSHMNLTTKAGNKRKAYKEEHWDKVSAKLGPTGLLCLLYRKRIKSNYRDIDTFTSAGINPAPILASLQEIVNEFAKIFESFIAAGIGLDEYNKIAESYLGKQESKTLLNRLSFIDQII